MKTFALPLLALLAWSFALLPVDSTELPAVFENDLIMLAIPLDHDTLLMYTDTGGKNFLYKSGLKKLETKRSRKNLWERSKVEQHLTKGGIPLPHKKEIYFTKDTSSTCDGMFGREWFAHKVWEFDYLNQSLKQLHSTKKSRENTFEQIPLYFKTDSAHNHIHHLPRILIRVESDTLSMLFDTGAQAFLSIEAQEKLQKKKLVATSFINASTFDRWTEKHPEWTVIQGGDESFGGQADIIVVPQIQIGQITVGPVEFARRADPNFQVMSRYFMDQEIVGALGGNAFTLLNTMILDYQNEALSIPKKVHK